jgi:hypothetical protein
VRPPQPAGVAELGYSKKTWQEEQGPERYRRGLYIHFQRTTPYPMLVNFDAPSTLVTAVKRERSNTPLQALNLLNDPAFWEAAQALAVRSIEEDGDDGARLARMFRLCLSRDPEGAEKDRLLTFLGEQRSMLKSEEGAAGKIAPFVPQGLDVIDVAAWTGVARGLMNLDEFIVRE